MKIINFEELESTNTYLKEHYNEYDDCTVIRAFKQTKGRGRFARIWESKNDLTFSILFKTKKIAHHFIAPLAVSSALAINSVKSVIKWPNDILVEGKKVCGILIEKILNKDTNIDIVGIGVNIEERENYSYLNFYKEIKPSLLLEDIIKMYNYYGTMSIVELHKLYKEKNFIINKDIIYNETSYKAVDINYHNELVLENIDKEIIVVNANELDLNTMSIKK